MPQNRLYELEQQFILPPDWDTQEPSSPTLADSGASLIGEAGSEIDHVGSYAALDTYYWKPLPPLPLNPNNDTHRIPGDLQPWRTNHPNSSMASSPDSQTKCYIRSCFQELVELDHPEDLDRKNKPLPLEPICPSSAQHQLPFKSANGEHGIEEPQILFPSSSVDTRTLFPHHSTLRYPNSQGQLSIRSSHIVDTTVPGNGLREFGKGDCPGLLEYLDKGNIDQCPTSDLSTEGLNKSTTFRNSKNSKRRWRWRQNKNSKEKLSPTSSGQKIRKCVKRVRAYRTQSLTVKPQRAYQSSLGPLPRPCPQSTMIGMEPLHEQSLLKMLFGFDLMSQIHPLNGARLHQVRQSLNSQPHPDTVINDERYPIVSCVWLRNFIIASPHRLDIDRGRLRGLKLDDESSQTVHRGFGHLWDFLETCGLKASYQNGVVSRCEEMDKEKQLQWFQHRDIKASETEDMLQIWNVLKSLLLKHSAQRQIRKQGLEQHAGENVVVFMKCGLGEIQQYFTGTNDTGNSFWDGSSIDGFFGAACLEWQDK